MNVVFIFSQPRAGSTMLQRMLSTHQEVTSVSETWLLLPQIYLLKKGKIISEYNHTIANVAIDDFVEELNGGIDDYYESLHDFMIGLYSRTISPDSNPAYFLEKTPRYYLIIDEIVKIFPNAKFVYLIRNPLSVMASVINSWHNGKLSFGMHHMDIFEAPRLLATGFKKYEDRSHMVAFEDIATNPEKSISDILDYLELGNDEKILTEYQNTRFKRMKPSETKYKGMDLSKLNEWETTFNTRYRAKFVEKYIRSLGEETLTIMGVDYFETLNKIEEIQAHSPRSKGISDAFHYFFDRFCSYMEWPFVRRRLKQHFKKDTKNQYYL